MYVYLKKNSLPHRTVWGGREWLFVPARLNPNHKKLTWLEKLSESSVKAEDGEARTDPRSGVHYYHSIKRRATNGHKLQGPSPAGSPGCSTAGQALRFSVCSCRPRLPCSQKTLTDAMWLLPPV